MIRTAVHVLIVDDEELIRSSLSAVITQLGHSVRVASDGFSALAEIRLHQPDIILSDLNMPGMSGFEFLSIVRRLYPGVDVIAMSGIYSTIEVPLGVAADFFHSKIMGMESLLHIIDLIIKSEPSTSAKRLRSPVPIWVPFAGDGRSEVATMILACPECLRTFVSAQCSALNQIHETNCIFCNSVVLYAILQPRRPVLVPGPPSLSTGPKLPPKTLTRKSKTKKVHPASSPFINDNVLTSALEENMLLVHSSAKLPKKLEVAFDEFNAAWKLLVSGNLFWLEKKVRTLKWHCIPVPGEVQEGGIGQTSIEAIERALELAIRNVRHQHNIVEICGIKISPYPWFFVANVRIRTYQVQKKASLAFV